MHIIFLRLTLHLEKVVNGDDAGIENTKEEEPKNTNFEESKDEPPLEALQRKENQHKDLPKTQKFIRDYLMDQVIGHPIQDVRTKRALRKTCEYIAYISQIEPKSFKEAEHDESWINAI